MLVTFPFSRLLQSDHLADICFTFLLNPCMLKTGEVLNAIGFRKGDSHCKPTAAQIPSIIITYSNVQGTEQPSGYSSGLLFPKNSSHSQDKDSSSQPDRLYQGVALASVSGETRAQLSTEDLPKLP